MKRRTFILLSTSLVATVKLQPTPALKGLSKHRALLEALLAHLFPPHSALPSAKELGVIDFFIEAVAHPSFDRDIRRFIIDGTERFAHFAPDFIKANADAKERYLRRFVKNDFGDRWVARVMIVALEGILGDPIYGANRGGAAWRALHTRGGSPRPKGKYLEELGKIV